MVGQVVKFGGNGFGQVLAAAAVAILVRLFSGPGPAMSPDDDEKNDFAGDDEVGEASFDGKIVPVAIRWNNITCSLSDKSSKQVCRYPPPPNTLLRIVIFIIFLQVMLGCRENVEKRDSFD